jgi:transposase-like protein
MAFGDHVTIGAVGVDAEGHKHVLAIREGTTENATLTKELLADLVVRGVHPDQKRLFAIDGSKALRTAINAVFGSHQPVQRCRTHKLPAAPAPRRCAPTNFECTSRGWRTCWSAASGSWG